MNDELLTDEDLKVLKDGRWDTIGFTGLFATLLPLNVTSEEAIAEFEAKLPSRLPFRTNSGLLGLRIHDRMPNPTVLVVRTDAGALMDIVTGGPSR